MEKQAAASDELRIWELERSLAHDQVTVWEAITDREMMRHWSPFEVVGTRSLGAPITVARRDAKEPENGHIVSFERPRLFTWTAGGHTLSWELLPAGDGACTLRFVETLDAETAGPASHAEWDVIRHELATQLDALEAHLAGAPASDATRPYLAARGV